MTVLKRILKIFLSLLLLCLIFIAGAVTYIVHNPQRAWQIVESRFLPQDLKITWAHLNFDLSPQATRKWTPSLSVRDLCLVKKDPNLEVCFNQLEIESRFSLERILSPEIVLQRVFAVSNYQNFLQLSEKNENEEKKGQSFYQSTQNWRSRLERWLGIIAIEQVKLRIEHFEIRQQGHSPLVLALESGGTQFMERISIDFGIQRSPAFKAQIQGEAYLRNFINMEREIAKLSCDILTAKLKMGLDDIGIAWNSRQEIISQGKIQAALPEKMTVETKIKSYLNKDSLLVQLRADLGGLKKPLDKLSPIQAEISIPQENDKLWADKSSSFSASATLPVFFVDRKLKPQVEKVCRCHLPKNILMEARGEGNLQTYFSDKDGFLLEAQAQVQSMNNDLFRTETKLQIGIARRSGEIELKPFIDSEIEVRRFQGLVALLKSQNIIVPTPFSVLDGRIQWHLKGPLNGNRANWQVPFKAMIKLASERQNLDITSQGYADLDFDAKIIEAHIGILIRQLVLQLPPMDPIYGVPKIAKDKRFELRPKQTTKKQGKGFAVRFFVQVKTEQPESIRLLSNLASPSVPIALNLNYQSGSPIQGQILLSNFDIEYLKRKSTVEKLQVDINDPKGTFPLDGRFRVDSNPYRIFIEVRGTLKAPQILLSSEPYLDRSDIISVLLYGRTNDRLVAVDSKTVGSFDAALADRAIGLLGIWAFASTPIQSFSYNQLNQQYTAQLKLADDTTLAVGTNWEEAASLELQKRLSEKWVISASLEPTEDEETARKLRLQWENRF